MLAIALRVEATVKVAMEVEEEATVVAMEVVVAAVLEARLATLAVATAT